MMSGTEIWLTIGGLTLLTFITRNAFLMLGQRVALPERLQHALRYAPACALAAIIVPDLLFRHGQLHFALDNFRLLAGLIAIGVFAVTRSTIGTIIGGMTAFWLLRAWLG
jgi:branched-subunit amino acid transport protein